ncbi:MAG: glycoside hydrolase family 76 protein [bacterium]|nr:glycoside hydrolase family 76 protein [bacterium]
MLRLFIAVFVVFISFGWAVNAQSTEEETAVERVERAVEVLMEWYEEETGTFTTTGWWNSANALYTVIDSMARTGSAEYLDEVANTYERNIAGGFLNEFYDDEGWWALTWIHAYDLTGETRYLEVAEAIFADITGAWDEVCGGGVWWTRERNYKNAIPNELFLLTAAKLYNRTENAEYLDWAQRTWNWFRDSGMINELNLVNDGLRDCENNRDITWTYNQGVILGGLVELYRATGDEALLTQATAIADAAITLLVDENGILREPCELSFNCGNDGPQFKGIFMRHLRTLYDATGEARYWEFIQHNAESIWERARNEEDQLGLRWGARFDRADAARHSSALDALLVAVPGSES